MLHVSFSNALFMSHTVWCCACVQYQDVPGSKWWLLSNVLARVGKTGKTAANYNNSRPWIGLFQDVKYDNVPKCNLEFEWGKSIIVAVNLFSLFHIILFLIILPTKFLRASSAWHRTPTSPIHTRGHAQVSEPLRNERRWYSELFSVQGNATFVSPMYKHTPILRCHFHIYGSSFAKPAASSRSALRFSTLYIHSTS